GSAGATRASAAPRCRRSTSRCPRARWRSRPPKAELTDSRGASRPWTAPSVDWPSIEGPALRQLGQSPLDGAHDPEASTTIGQSDLSSLSGVLEFHAVAEPRPGAGFQERFQATWPAYRSWYLRDGDAARSSYVACRHA